MTKEETITQLKEDLTRFKERSAKEGWESDEVDEKVAEAFENFPWYKYKKTKRSWFSILWGIFLVSLVLFMAGNAYLSKNRRMKKNINDYIFDLQLPYLQSRIIRRMFLPILKAIDLRHYGQSECLWDNPFFKKDPVKCEFCENMTSIPLMRTNNEEIQEMMLNGDIFKLRDEPTYSKLKIGFLEFKQLFDENAASLDEAICSIYISNDIKKVSAYFNLTEGEIKEKKLSIGWRNCEGYGARFYRKYFPRPSFVSKMSEIMLEKVVYLMHSGTETDINDSFPNGSAYIFQAHGSSEVSFNVHEDCDAACSDAPLKVNLNQGEMVVYPMEGWNVTSKATGQDLTVLYVSGFANS